ncbi:MULTISPECIES: amidohydrolase family protein [Flavobacterium]|uniref:Amidohydrolase family protein n=1 Tax=Flavobacterium covae TaxID=2906076 RepID=A0ABW8PKH2_9FLAO|nr:MULTISPECIES: amidohydrolase family protein [Flavobacterium]OXA77182.1 amidohydrolase [Flavobacterium columnare] [Flavobacterium columnare NBRC 100251 = ATCC 23463]AMA48644.1 amidohydrolase [Flavobacterium covae]AND65231.1 amidohydrolase [Flavobacterium covae]MCJ1807048.1 amidohydrolase family protein [Flavobacterium covae]MCJ1808371.1 amidohydrolase family protein [Flavobacterium covae]
MKTYIKLLYSVLFITGMYAQQIPAPKQTKSILIINAIAHLGNGQLIENSAIGFKDGKLNLIADARLTRIDLNSYDEVIKAEGKHIYPGFIAPNSTIGLVEIDAVKATNDEREIGSFTPNVRSLIAYNTESKIIETARINGVLTAQITPRGGYIAGTSSIVQMDAWTWEDAIIKENDGIHCYFPITFKKTGWWAEPGTIEVNKEYLKEVTEFSDFLKQAKAYLNNEPIEKNIVFESMRGIFNGTQTLYVNAYEEKQIIDAIRIIKENNIQKMVIIGGYQADKVAPLLVQNNIGVLVGRVHSLPNLDHDDIDQPFKLAKILMDKGVLVGLENSGDMERMNTRNLPFLAGTTVAYGLTKEQALQTITLNTAKILGIDSTCGSLEVGKEATLFISEGDALDMRTNNLSQAYIQGRKISLESHQTQLNDKYKKKYNIQ